MTTTLRTTKAAVRRFLLHTQLLLERWPAEPGTSGPDQVMRLIRTLGCVQIDPVAAVTGNQHLVLGARDPGYDPAHLHTLLREHKVFEYFANAACVIPMEDYAYFEPVRARLRERLNPSLQRLEITVQHVLQRLAEEGPLPSKAFRAVERVSGYWDRPDAPKTKDTSLALNLLLDTAAIRVVARQGNERYFQITEPNLVQQRPGLSVEQETHMQQQALLDKYIHAYRVVDTRDARLGWLKWSAAERRAQMAARVADGRMIQLEIEGVVTPYYIRTEDEELLLRMQQDETHYEASGPVRFLPPLDNLLWRRERIVDLFDYHYKWEIYTPEAKRTYGYYAMPILHGDRLIGRMDPRLDRKTGTLTVRLLSMEENAPPVEEWMSDFRDGLAFFATMHGAQSIKVEKTVPAALKKGLKSL
ncbi:MULTISPECIES: winged helix-turn-helix domain-containing protein [Paenibacillus]|uniref:winged helix-turn-helix domain-containing protein n=1 Tax=Paenibacillus TaxID=44249 RepID=UPI00129D6035|nr:MULTISPECIES: crosslink repair DNA glycosylase YcaQ family protein [Paenibacillus]MBE7683562.1 winged helix-turn-helix domain-containing protein [Paenibacillus sp. P13VS]